MSLQTAIAPNDSVVSALSPGEIAFLWSFIQGGIMDPPTRVQMRKAWGMCERHAWGWMSVEAAFRSLYLHGPAILYEDLMERAVAFFDIYGPMQTARVRVNLRERKPCLMCQVGFGPESKAFAMEGVLERGSDLSGLRSMAQKTWPYWRKAVCGVCAGTGTPITCRRHFVDAKVRSAEDFRRHKDLVNEMFHRLVRYSRSFRFGFHHTRTEEDAAALIMAVGWCSGWGILLSILDEVAAP